MKIHEYQGKEILARFGIPVPRGYPAFSVREASEAAQKLGGSVWVVKAQIHAGGRGKGGGVKLGTLGSRSRQARRRDPRHAARHASDRPAGTEGAPPPDRGRRRIKKEYYVAVLTDRATQKVAMMGSSEGGMDIEEVADETPEKIFRVFVDPIEGMKDESAAELAAGIGIPKEAQAQAIDVFKKLYACYMETDASLAEINPLILEGAKGGGAMTIKALDAKFTFDSNAMYRHPEIAAYRDLDEEDPAEIEASKFDLAYIQLDGNIGCLVNGAGLAMATMDTIKLFGGSPANFLDVGGGASAEKVTEAFKIMLGNPKVKAILVNIFGGIMRCDTIAEGVIAACKATNLSVPLVVRMKGTNEELGKKMLAESGLPIISADSMAEAAQKVMEALKMSILVDKNTRVITQGITGKTGQFHTRMCREYANGEACFVAGVNPKKAGEDFEGIPIFATVKDAARNTGATVSVIYVPPAAPPRRSRKPSRPSSTSRSASPRASRCATCSRSRAAMRSREAAREEDAAARAELPGPHHARRDQDRHHARPHPQEGPDRRRQPLGHAHLRGGRAAHRGRPRPVDAPSASAATRSMASSTSTS